MDIYRELIPDLQNIVNQYRFKKLEPLSKRKFKQHIASKRRDVCDELSKIFWESNGISNYQFGSWEEEEEVVKVEQIDSRTKRQYYKRYKVFVPSEYNKKWFRMSPKLRLRIAETPAHRNGQPKCQTFNRLTFPLVERYNNSIN